MTRKLLSVGFVFLVLLVMVVARKIDQDDELARIKRQRPGNWGECPEGQKSVKKDNGEYKCVCTSVDDSLSSQSSESSDSSSSKRR